MRSCCSSRRRDAHGSAESSRPAGRGVREPGQQAVGRSSAVPVEHLGGLAHLATGDLHLNSVSCRDRIEGLHHDGLDAGPTQRFHHHRAIGSLDCLHDNQLVRVELRCLASRKKARQSGSQSHESQGNWQGPVVCRGSDVRATSGAAVRPKSNIASAGTLHQMEQDSAWRWEDPRWRQRVGRDRQATLDEATRRAVDLRDMLAEADRSETERAVMLVDVLNHLRQLPA
jgi:hypothetical protein